MKRFLQLCRYQWDRTAAVLLTAGGFVAITVAALRARGSVFAFEQFPLLISGGIVGMCLVAVGIGSWISADLRDAWRKLDDLDETIRMAALAKTEPGSMRHADVRAAVAVDEVRQA